MTQYFPPVSLPPPPPPISYEPLPVYQRRGPNLVIILICWTIILLIVGLAVVSNIDRTKTSAEKPEDNATMTAVAHCVVGAHALAGSADKSAQATVDGTLVAEMDMVAKSPADRLREAIVVGEIISSANSNTRLDSLAQTKNLPAPLLKELEIVRIINRDGPGAISDSQRALLVDHEGWFGELALTRGKPETDPQRSRVLGEAKRAYLVTIVAAVIGFGALVVAAGLIVLAIILAATQRLPLWFRRGLPDSIFLEGFAVYLAGFVLLSLFLHFAVHTEGLGWSLLMTIMLPIALAWPVFRGKPWSQTRLEVGWHSGKGVLWELGCGIVGYLTALPLLAIMMIITLQLIRLSGSTPSHPISNYLNGGPGEIVLIYFIACVWAPVFEESMFRGLLFNHLRANHGWWISAGIVGLIFAAIHPQGWTTIPILGGIGVVLCALREWRGSLIASMAAHALSNGTVLTLAILTSR
jgi:membrane protease YdiL (CAAX protease family)